MNEIMSVENAALSNPFSSETSFAGLMKVAEAFSRTAIVPQVYQGKPEDCMIAIDMANRMGVSPMFVMQNLYVVKGKPSWSGQACMSLIKANSEFTNVHPVYTGERGTNGWGCHIEATRKSDGTIVKGPEITIGIAKAEGWFSKKDKFGNETSKWQTMPELMLAYRASAFFSRVYIPDALMGCSVEGEADDQRTEIKKESEEIKDLYAENMAVEGAGTDEIKSK